MATANSNLVHCDHCAKDVEYHYDPLNHWKHLLFSVCTLGLWLPFWLFATLSPSKLCNQCGNHLWSTDVAPSPPSRRKPS